MSEHHHDHAEHHGHDHGSERPFFDESTSILAPVYIIIALLVVFGVLFFG